MAWLKIFILSTALCWPTSEIEFEKKQMLLGEKKLTVEIADSIEKRSQGLMYRQKLKPGQGMLFIHDQPEVAGYWMKNTFIDLSIGFFDENKKLVEIYDLKKTPSVLSTRFDQVQSRKKVKYALEVPKGWFKANNIKPGVKFKLID
ncbi:MAG: DUF192 domain-containing protein [Bdellovibrionales bacterium]|nr:DUF192 domain-containing protein [Bdellovibrionales bacterium]